MSARVFAAPARAVGLVLLGSALLAVLQGAACAEEAPPFSLIRADEDYRYLRNPGAPRTWEDGFKFIPLDGAGEIFLSFGGEWRERMESYAMPKFGIGTRNDSYVLQRVLLHGDLHLGDRLRAFTGLGKHDVFDKDQPYGPTDRGDADLQVAFVDVIPDPDEHLTVRLGRQELLFNPTQRFVSVREGPNIRQSFDGGRASWKDAGYKIDVFAVRPLVLKPGAFDDAPDHGQRFWGANVETSLAQATVLDVYAFELDRARVRYGAISGTERRSSLGARLAGQRSPWDYDLEALAQFGAVGGREIHAWAGSLDTGYMLLTDWSPRLGLRFDAGSGGSDAGNGTVGTFQPLFPKGAYFNETSLTSWSNLLAMRPSLRVQPLKSLTLEASILMRWRQNPADAVYLQPSTPIASTLNNRAREIGQAYGLDAAWKVDRNFTLAVEVVHQKAGPAITRAGGHDSDLAMLITQFRF